MKLTKNNPSPTNQKSETSYKNQGEACRKAYRFTKGGQIVWVGLEANTGKKPETAA